MKAGTSRVKSSRIAHLGLALAVFAGPVWAQEQKPEPVPYTITDLGTLGGTFSDAAGLITNNGSMAGRASPPDGTWHAVLWQKGLIKDIATPGLGGANSEA